MDLVIMYSRCIVFLCVILYILIYLSMCQDDRPSVALGPSGEAALGTVSLLSVTSLLSMNICVVNCRLTGFSCSKHSERYVLSNIFKSSTDYTWLVVSRTCCSLPHGSNAENEFYILRDVTITGTLNLNCPISSSLFS